MPSRVLRVLQITGFTLAVMVIGSVAAQAQRGARADSSTLRITADTSRSDSMTTVVPMTLGQKAALYSGRTFSLRAVLGASYAAGIAQWRGTPKEWGAGMSGYARRDAAAYGGGIIRHTVEFGVGALFHEDPRFERSTRNGFTARTEDALRNTLFVRTDDGNHRLAWSRAAAALATGFAVNSWEPRRLHSTHHALMLSLAGALGYATGHVTQEFTPDIKRFLFRGTPLEGRF